MAYLSPSSLERDASPRSTEHDTLMEGKRSLDSMDDLYVRRRTRWQRLKKSGQVLRIVLEVVLCLLLLVNLNSQSIKKLFTKAKPQDLGALHQMSFGKNVEYMSLDHKYDPLWADEESAYRALVRTNPDEINDEAQWGSVAMFHQLHCLTSFRAALQKAREGVDPGIDHDDNKHWPHCFWYLRQAILCHADDQIELPEDSESFVLPNGTTSTRRTGSINGATDVRTCRDSDKLYRLRLEHGAESEGYKIDLAAERLVSDGLIRNNTGESHESDMSREGS